MFNLEFWFPCLSRASFEKKDEDAFLDVFKKWQTHFSPFFIEAGHDALLQKQRVDDMVTELLRLKLFRQNTEEVEAHCVQVVSQCTPDVRGFLVKALASSAESYEAIDRIQRRVLGTCTKVRY